MMYINKIWEVNGSEDERMVYAEIEILRQQYLNSNFKVVEMKDNDMLKAIQLEVY